jgi:alpha-N-acetylglucosamine transferase
VNSYVTLIANPDYLPGARALARSLKMVRSRWPLTALALAPFDGLKELEALGCTVKVIENIPLSDAFQERHTRESQHKLAPFTRGGKPAFHNPLFNFAKLRLWELEQFRKVVFLDADTLVIRNIDRLFRFPEFSAAPNLYESLQDFHRMNSGVFVARPSRKTYQAMLARLDQPDAFWKRTDQTFLETYFPRWDGLPYIYNALQYVWFNLPELWDWRRIRVIHYQYEKPWEAENPKRRLLAPLIDLWWHVYENGKLPRRIPTSVKYAKRLSIQPR